MSTLLLSEVHNFIRHELRRALRKDLRALKILKESDMECCAYFHLRKFLGRDASWRIFTRKHSRKIRRYPDLVIYHNNRQKLFLELKWHRRKISGKDRKTLGSARAFLRAKKTYFLCALPDASEYSKLKEKTAHERYRLFECIIGLGYKSPHRIAAWEKSRKAFRH